MTDDTKNRWQSRTKLLIGTDATARLARAHVAVFGLGGVGGIAAEMLARAGIGKLTLIDGDCVEESNLNRQAVAWRSTLGRKKAEVMADRVRDINPEIVVTAIAEYVERTRIEEILAGANYDFVLDAIDSMAPKLDLAETALARQIPIVSSMGAGALLSPENIRCADVAKTNGCPLARAYRQGLRKRNITHGILTVFSPDERICYDSDAEAGTGKRVNGTISYLPAIFGCFCASVVIRHISETASTSA